MNEKITLPSLVALLSARTSDTKKQTEDFVKEFFASVSELLAAGEQVKIKDIGVFKTVAVEARKSVNVSTGEEYLIPGHRKVVFIPSREIAAEVNEPFEMFETVELSEDYTEEEITEAPKPVEQGSMDIPEEQDSPVIPEEPEEPESAEIPEKQELPEIPEEPDLSVIFEDPADAEMHSRIAAEALQEEEEFNKTIEEVEAAEAADASDASDAAKASEAASEVADEGDAVPETSPISRVTPPRRRFRFVAGFACGFLLAVAIIAVYAIVNYDQWKKMSPIYTATQQETVTPAPAKVPADTIAEPETGQANDASAVTPAKEETEAEEEVPTRPSDQKVYDTITKTRYLTTMAKDHYGNYNLWPYIYLENESFLGHPDRIRPGTKVVVPPLSKYGINPKNPADIAKAKRKGVEIYARYK